MMLYLQLFVLCCLESSIYPVTHFVTKQCPSIRHNQLEEKTTCCWRWPDSDRYLESSHSIISYIYANIVISEIQINAAFMNAENVSRVDN